MYSLYSTYDIDANLSTDPSVQGARLTRGRGASTLPEVLSAAAIYVCGAAGFKPYGIREEDDLGRMGGP
jgi:hypothetical protein